MIIKNVHIRHGNDALSCFFGLSKASFLTLPRVLMEQMPDEWQGRMAVLLNEMGEKYTTGELEFTVHCKDRKGRFKRIPSELLNYRHPDDEALMKYEVKIND
jgi:hypothetical protein